MIAHHVHHALAQVRELQDHVIQGQRFKGYSGGARLLSGIAAMAGAAVMASPSFPRTDSGHVTGWGVVLAAALLLNYGALLHWFFFDPGVGRDPRRLKPAIDGIPPLLAGAALSAVFIRNGDHAYLFGSWMCMFGLANLASRHCLPRGIFPLGLYYLACGAACLALPLAFTNPWPMGIVFFVGEAVGGYIYRETRQIFPPVGRIPGILDGEEIDRP